MSIHNKIISALKNKTAIVIGQERGQFLSIWKRLAHEKKLTRYDMALYCLSKALRSKEDHTQEAKRYLRLAFSPVTNPKKLANGHKPYGVVYDALWCMRGANSELLLSLDEEEREEITNIITAIKESFLSVGLS